MSGYQASALWRRINDSLLAHPDDIALETFRDTRGCGNANVRIAGWEVNANALRFFKTILLNEGMLLDDVDMERLDRIAVRNLGNPVSVTVRGRSLCLDYLQAVLELRVLSQVPGPVRSIVEIGAGFGRTAHAILSVLDDICSYVILDLEPCLRLTQRYLEAVLPSFQFAKIKFVAVEGWDGEIADFDIAININSFAEMEAGVVDEYLAMISRRGSYFYCKNPLGKYAPESVGAPGGEASEGTRLALASGKLTNVIDIFDDQALGKAVDRFHQVYQPPGAWSLLAEGNARPWMYYYESLYARNSGR